jgi:hypothetical protein
MNAGGEDTRTIYLAAGSVRTLLVEVEYGKCMGHALCSPMHTRLYPRITFDTAACEPLARRRPAWCCTEQR